jgi:phospholipid/cholesterol/gamma-HCH transport system substrate-binding protein
MPIRTGRLVFGRVLVITALIAVVLLCIFLLLNASSGYHVKAIFDDAGQLTKGNQVKVGGVPVGSIDDIKLIDQGHRAEIDLSIDGDMAPLHEGTTATIRNPSLTSIAGRYLVLVPGPNSNPEIDDGGRIPTENTTEAVDLDQLLNSLDPPVITALNQVIQGSAVASRGRGKALARALHSLNPALSRSNVALSELDRDQAALEQLIVNSSEVVNTLAEHGTEITRGNTAAVGALRAIASERRALASTLEQAPATLRKATPTLAEVRGLLSDLKPTIPQARPLVRGLSRLLPNVRPTTASLRGVIPSLRALVATPGNDNDATDLLRRLPPLAGEGVPVLGGLTGLTDEARPVLSELRAYAPDFTGGIMAGFGGSSGGYYDANGAYARISFLGGPFSLAGLPPIIPPLGEIRQGAVERCPGAANYPVSDGSNPFVDPSVSCDPSLAGAAP